MFAYSLLTFLLEQISAVSGISKGLVEAADSEEELATVESVATVEAVEAVEAVEVATVASVSVTDALECGLNQVLNFLDFLGQISRSLHHHTYECI